MNKAEINFNGTIDEFINDFDTFMHHVKDQVTEKQFNYLADRMIITILEYKLESKED